MDTYLDKMLKKTMATSCKKLREISEIKHQNDVEHKKILQELQLNNIIKNFQIYMDKFIWINLHNIFIYMSW
jgi:hypothetical protein